MRKRWRNRPEGGACDAAETVIQSPGTFGKDVLLIKADEQATEELRQRFRDRVQSLGRTGIAYEVVGGQQDLYERTFPDAALRFITQEFGTYSAIRVLEALRAENLDQATCSQVSLNSTPKRALLEMFNPNQGSWRDAVLARGHEVLRQAISAC